MKIKTDIERIDLIKFNLVILPRMKSTYTTILFIAVLVFAWLSWQHGLPETAHEWLGTSIAAIAGGIGGLLFGIAFSSAYILLSSSNTNGILGLHEYEISDEGLHEKTNANEGLSKWEGIEEVKIAGPYILFRISGFLYHIIPKRSFVSVDAFNDFFRKSENEWQRVHNK